MAAEELTSVTTSRAEFNLITNNSSLMGIWLDVRWSSLLVNVCLCFIFVVCIFGNNTSSYTHQSTSP